MPLYEGLNNWLTIIRFSNNRSFSFITHWIVLKNLYFYLKNPFASVDYQRKLHMANKLQS
jgi:hypothetical protein